LYVLDHHMQPVPGRHFRETCTSAGSGVAAGILKRPDLTADDYVSDPFGGPAGAYTALATGRVRIRWQREFLGRAMT